MGHTSRCNSPIGNVSDHQKKTRSVLLYTMMFVRASFGVGALDISVCRQSKGAYPADVDSNVEVVQSKLKQYLMQLRLRLYQQ